MSVICRLLAHAPIPSRLWNGGFYFTKCARCECDLIRRGVRWKEIPDGYQVVWREAEGPAEDWTPWSPGKLRKAPSLTELLASIGPVPAAARAADAVSPDTYRRVA